MDIALRLLGEGGDLDARGVSVTEELLQRFLAAAPHDEHGDAVLTDADFSRATFLSTATFAGCVFRGDALFDGATFKDDAQFGQATFKQTAWFAEATFLDAWFSSATFSGDAVFSGATFKDDSGFASAIFEHIAWFNFATFKHVARFDDATFKDATRFEKSRFRGTVDFRRATFKQTRTVGPLLACRGLVLDGVLFKQPVRIEASTPGLCCHQAQFDGGVQFWLRWARVVLDDTYLANPSTLAGIPRLTDDGLAIEEQQLARAWRRLLTREISERPRLLSLQRADVAGLGLSKVELADCRFAGAHNLDKLRMEADVSLVAAPTRPGRDRRQVIAEERTWRAQHSSRWTAPLWPDWTGAAPEVLEPGQIAGLYRALQKGREDNHDEPGAADFYYGEMEMRRHARSSPASGNASSFAGGASRGRAERSILTVYWLVSGYGLRAWRALACLAAVIAGFAIAFHLIGFTTPPRPASYWTSLLYAFRATLSLTDNEVKLTAWAGCSRLCCG